MFEIVTLIVTAGGATGQLLDTDDAIDLRAVVITAIRLCSGSNTFWAASSQKKQVKRSLSITGGFSAYRYVVDNLFCKTVKQKHTLIVTIHRMRHNHVKYIFKMHIKFRKVLEVATLLQNTSMHYSLDFFRLREEAIPCTNGHKCVDWRLRQWLRERHVILSWRIKTTNCHRLI